MLVVPSVDGGFFMTGNKTYMGIASLALAFLGCMVFLAFTADRQASAVSDSVLRFHVVANSDDARDQELKLLVRDEIARLTDKMFATAQSKEQAIEIAAQNQTEIQTAAKAVLLENGCADDVEVEIKNLFFPTKHYENVTFPAGTYDAIHITIGEGKGKNFWCVMFPALCVPSVSKDNAELLSSVLGEEEVQLVTHPYTLKFKTAELLGKLKHLFQ